MILTILLQFSFNPLRENRDEEVVCYRNLGCFKDEGPFDYLDT